MPFVSVCEAEMLTAPTNLCLLSSYFFSKPSLDLRERGPWEECRLTPLGAAASRELTPSRGHTHKQPHSKTCRGACITLTFCSKKRKKKQRKQPMRDSAAAEHTLHLPHQKTLEAGTGLPEGERCSPGSLQTRSGSLFSYLKQRPIKAGTGSA